MKFLLRLGVRVKLFTVLGVICGFAVLSVAVSLYYSSQIVNRTEEVLRVQRFEDTVVQLAFFDTAFTNIARAYIAGHSDATEKVRAGRTEEYSSLVVAIRELAAGDEDYDFLNKILPIRDKLIDIESSVFDLVKKGNAQDALILLSSNDYSVLKTGFSGLADQKIKEESEKISIFEASRTALLRLTGIVAIFCLLALALVGGTLAYIVSSIVGRAVREFEEVAEAIGRGETGKRIAVRANDEVGRAAVVFNKMAVALDNAKACEKLKEITRDIGQ